MIENEDASTNEKQEELKQLIRDAKLLGAARSISLPVAGVASILSAALGPLAFIGASGVAAFIAVSRHQLANKRNRAFALASELHSKGRITDAEFEEYTRILRVATEGSGVSS